MNSVPPSADAIQQEMQQVRAEMREDVREMVAGAREMADWTYYVRTYPWVCVGAAAAIGYLVIPSRSQPVLKPDMKDLLELAKNHKLVVKMDEPKAASPGLVGTLLRMAAGSLLQGGLAIATQQFDQFVKQQQTRATSPNGNGRGPHHG